MLMGWFGCMCKFTPTFCWIVGVMLLLKSAASAAPPPAPSCPVPAALEYVRQSTCVGAFDAGGAECVENDVLLSSGGGRGRGRGCLKITQLLCPCLLTT